MTRIWPVEVLGDNYVWVIQSATRPAVAVVDPGDADPVILALDEHGLSLAAILITHHHADHTAGVGALLARAEVPVYGPVGERIPNVSRPVSGADRVEIDEIDLALDVIDVPGHTAGHVAYSGEGFVFCGDTLFAGGCGRIFEGTPDQMVTSLSRLTALPPDTEVHCAHEYTVSNLRFGLEVERENAALHARLEDAQRLRADGRPTVPSTLSLELDTNVFLRCAEPSVIEAAERHAGRGLADEVEVFATVRRWKDGWRG